MKPAAWMFGAAWTVAAGCLLNTQGSGTTSHSRASSSGSSSSGGPTTSGSSSTSLGTTETGTTDATTGETSTGERGSAQVVIEAGPTVDFGLIELPMSAFLSLTLRNEGTAVARDLEVSLSPPFDFTAGVYPGASGDCGPTLRGGQSCTVEISFEPTALGPMVGALDLTYMDDQGPRTTAVELAGAGSGTLLVPLLNAGAEDVGSPPPGWTPVSGSWETSGQFSSSGLASITGLAGETLGLKRLQQSVDVTEFAAAIDELGLEVRFTAMTRSLEAGDDPGGIAMSMQNGAGQELADESSSLATTIVWVPQDVVIRTPAMTRSVTVELVCELGNGMRCDAYFDDMTLLLTYPPS